jgi:MoxR-like ATPase
MNTELRTSPLEFEVAMDEAAALLEVLTDEGDPVMLWGAPGIGKTDIVHQLAHKKGRKVIEFHAA